MLRKVLLVVGGLVAGLVLVAAVLAATLLGTAPGHAVARRLAVNALRGAVDGTVTIGSLSGSLRHAADLRDVQLSTPDGRPVIRVGHARVTYALADLARNRFVLSHVELDRPTVTLEEGADGRLNIEHLFRLVGPSRGSSGRRPLVELNGVRLSNGTVVLRERADSAGLRRTRQFLGIGLEASVRASHPDSVGLKADLRHLAIAVTDPDARVMDAAGTVLIAGDSVRFDLSKLVLPGSAGRARGTVRLGKGAGAGRPKLEVLGDLRRLSLADFRWAVPGLPKEGAGRAAVHLSLLAGGGTAFSLRDADLRAGPSQVNGSAAVVVGPKGGVKIDSLDVTAKAFDLALLAPFLGKMPVAGTVDGRIRASGTPDRLNVRAALALRDAGVLGRPASRLGGFGLVSVGGSAGFAFQRFTLTGADVALGTIQKLAPPVTLHGRLALSGTLDGPWRDAAFQGALRHYDGDAASVVRGSARLTLADTVRIAADLVADTLSLDDLARSYPVIPVRGIVSGPLTVEGPVTALAIEAALSAPAGRGGLNARGVIGARDSAVEIQLRGSLDSLDLSGRFAGAPATRLSGEWRAELRFPTADTLAAPTGTLSVTLDRGRFAGVALARAGIGVTLKPQSLQVDTAYLERPGVGIAASGAVGRRGEAAGQLAFALHADTLTSLEPLVAWVRRAAGADSAAGRVELSGAGCASGRLTGTLDAWRVEGDVDADRVVAGTLTAQNARLSGSFARSARGPRFAVKASADTLEVGALKYSGVEASATGLLDTLDVRLGASFALGSSAQIDVAVSVDSSGWSARVAQGRFALPRKTWEIVGAPRIAATRDWVTLDSLLLRTADGSFVRAAGRVPLAGAGDAGLEMDSVPLVDLYALAQSDTTGVDGLLTGKVRLAGRAADPGINLTAALADGRFGDFRAPLIRVAADYAARRLAVRAALFRDQQQVLTAVGSLPLDLALAPVARRQLPDSLSIRVQADSVDLGVVDALTALVRDVKGQLTADVEVRGTWDKPALNGSVRIAGGAATVPALGARYTGIEARGSLDGDRLRLEAARIGGGTGALEVAGGVTFAALTRPVLDLQLNARGFAAFTQRDFAGLTASGRLALTGPTVGATLSGAVTVDAGFLAFADLVEKRIVNLDDPEFRAAVDSNLLRASGPGPSVPIVFLDSLRIRGLTVTMGPDVWLRSHEANIQLAGEFTVATDVEGGASRSRLDGELRAVRGTYRLVVGPSSKEFRVTRGTVRFFGTPDLNPVLDIVAEHSVRAVQGNDLVVRAVIGGTLMVPRLALESDQRPPLSETEIVSYLLFGRPSFDLASGGAAGGTRSEQAIFQGALAGLAGVLSGELEQKLVADLGIPVDYIAIRPGGGSVGDIFGSTRVEAGTQIGERTFLTLNAGLCQVTRGLSSQALGASVEYRLARRWSMEASVEPTVQECRPSGFQIRPPAPYQVGFDLFWQSGVP